MINLLIFLIVVVCVILLQIFLSRTESKWPGLVLPVLTFLLSLILPLNVMATPDIGAALLLMLVVLLIGNIPTVILLVIYFVCREKFAKKKQMEKMQILDLE